MSTRIFSFVIDLLLIYMGFTGRITLYECFCLILLNGIWLEARTIRDGGKRDE